MSSPRLKCCYCVHYENDWKCAAFPKGIPGDIIEGSFDHDNPHKGDNGIQFEVFEPFEEEYKEMFGVK